MEVNTYANTSNIVVQQRDVESSAQQEEVYNICLGESKEQYPLTKIQWDYLKENSEFIKRLATKRDYTWKEDGYEKVCFPEVNREDFELIINSKPTFSNLDQVVQALFLSSYFGLPALREAVEDYFEQTVKTIDENNFEAVRNVYRTAQQHEDLALVKLCELRFSQTIQKAKNENNEELTKLLASLHMEKFNNQKMKMVSRSNSKNFGFCKRNIQKLIGQNVPLLTRFLDRHKG